MLADDPCAGPLHGDNFNRIAIFVFYYANNTILNKDDIIVNISGIEPGDFTKIYDPEQPKKV
jgi:hypothetical protein